MKAVFGIIVMTLWVVFIGYVIEDSGTLFNKIKVDKGSFDPNYGNGIATVYVWRRFNIIYSDDFKWQPNTYDSLLAIHLKAAHNFINTSK